MKLPKWTPIVLLALIGGCSSDSAAPAAKTLKVALLTPDQISDAGWSAMAYDGLMQIKKDMGAEVNNEVAEDPGAITEAMRAYAQKGYDIVFGHGFEYNAPAIKVAKDFPKTVFVSSSGGETAPNVGAFRFYLEQGFYLAGYMAASMSKTGKIAEIGGDDVPSIRSTFDGFEAGAKAAKPNIVIITKFTGNGNDIAAAKEATLAAISQGADFVIHQADAGAQGVFDACKAKGVYALGSNLDQNNDASGVVIASAVIDAGPAFETLAKEVQAGTFKGSIELMGMDTGAIDFVINPKLQDKVPAALVTKLADLKKQIAAGTIKVPMRKF